MERSQAYYMGVSYVGLQVSYKRIEHVLQFIVSRINAGGPCDRTSKV